MPSKINLEALEVLKNKEFSNLIIGRFFLVLGFKMTSTLLGWWVYELTQDPLAIGFIGLSEVIPAVSCALYAGYIIDMNEKRRLLLLCNMGYIVLLTMLLIMALFQDYWGLNNDEATYFIYFIVFFTGIVRAFLGPIVPTMIPKIVGKNLLPRAVTLNQTIFLSGSVLGHILGGFLIYLMGVKGTWGVIIGCFSVAFFFYFKVKPQPSEFKKSEVKALESIKEGLDYIFKTKEIVGALALDLFAVLFGGGTALIPVFARDILQVGALGYGFLNAASNIGATIMILTLTFMPLRRNQGRIMIFAVFGFGLCILLFGLSRYFILSFFLLLMSGALDGISVVIRGTILQLKTPDQMKGRVMSVNSMFIVSSNELGQFESGMMGRAIGAVNAVVLGGGITMLIALWVGLTSPKLRNMEY